MSDNGSGELERKKRQLKQTFDEVMWPLKESILLAKYITRLVEQDVRDRCPDSYEKIVQLMDVHERMTEQLLDSIDEAVQFRKENDLNTDELYKASYDADDRRTAMRNLRLDLIRWLKWFEGPERPLPTPEEEAAAEAEKAEAYRTGGASLVAKRMAPEDTGDQPT